MNRAIVCHTQKPLPLGLGQITNQGDLFFDSVHDSFLTIAVAAVCGVKS
ncbi:MAG TPA: hypothetical protein VLW83_06790 [Candidatus Acidoferrales bacterium]|nr:hypothetical protein [Candidatus Acidoferrales bacterium]